MKQRIESQKAPKALGPYSQAILIPKEKELIFVSGQVPLDPQTGKLVEGDIKTHTRQVIKNLEAILIEAGSSLDFVVRTDVFLKDMKNDFTPMNEEYSLHFKGPAFPARQTVQVSELPLGAPIEISCIAILAN